MQDVARQTGLMKRGGTYSLRVVIPKDIRAAFGPIWHRERNGRRPRGTAAELTQVWIPLGTGDRRAAIEEANRRRVWLDGLFREARGQLDAHGPADGSPQTATIASINRVVRQYFYELEHIAPPVPLDDHEREQALDAAVEEISGLAASGGADNGAVQRVANSIARKYQLDIPENSPLLYDLAVAVHQAQAEHATRQTERLALQPIRARHPLLADIGPGMPPASTMTLREAVDAYKSAPERANRSPKTKAHWNFRLSAWCDLLGADRPVSAITRAEIKTARDTLMAVPANAVKRWPGKPWADVAALARKANITPMHWKSVQLYVDCFASLMKWLVIEGELASNPASGIGAPGKPQHEKAPRRRLTIDELRRLFASGHYADPAAPRGWKFWLPLIALFSGLREAEMVGLRAADVCEQDGLLVFDIKAHADRSLKTVQSARVVPVHSALQELGILDFAAGQPGGGMLFTDLPGRADNHINAAQKAIGRFVRAAFPNTPDVTFHSLRHTWKDAAENAYVPEAILERLVDFVIDTGGLR